MGPWVDTSHTLSGSVSSLVKRLGVTSFTLRGGKVVGIALGKYRKMGKLYENHRKTI